MAIKQLSIYAANTKGSLAQITKALAEEAIDLRSICVADTENFGILRLIVEDADRALEIVRNAGYTARVRKVVAVSIEDRPAALYEVLTLLSDAEINLEYMYSIINSAKGHAFMVLRVDDNDQAEQLLSDHGITVLNEQTIFL